MKLKEFYNESEQKILLNNDFVKRGVWNIIRNSFGYISYKRIKLKDISISDDSYLTRYKNHWIMRYDRHCHYTNPNDFLAATYDYFKSIEMLLKHNRPKWETIIKS